MKIYHTETQEDYDALMVELKMRGIKPLANRSWKVYENQTVVFVRAIGRYGDSTRTDTTYGDVQRALYKYPDTPITKYKAKADEKMKFTKENVSSLFYDWRRNTIDSVDELREQILELDDTPEKVVVPKFVAEFYKEFENAILEFLITQLEATYSRSELGEWYRSCSGRHRNGRANAQEVIAKMKLYGYEVKKEPLYYIPLPHLKTSDGIQQVLSKRENDKRYFASRPNDKLKQRFTKEELAQVPEIYKLYAMLIEEEE